LTPSGLRDEFALPDSIDQFHAAQLGSVLRIVTGEAGRLLIEGMSPDDLQTFLERTGSRMFDLLDGALGGLCRPAGPDQRDTNGLQA
jgi:hypothetical protein